MAKKWLEQLFGKSEYPHETQSQEKQRRQVKEDSGPQGGG